VLTFLCNFTARCPQACSSLAFTSPSAIGQDKQPIKNQHSNNSLVHCIVRLLQKEMTSSSNLLKHGFTLASTLALSPECRGILWKSNFLHEFSSVNPKRSWKKEKEGHLVHGLWLNLFVNLSFSSEGQNMIFKIDDSIMLLIEFGFSGHETLQKSSLLILRNLCFHSTSKPKLLANDKLIPLTLKSIEFGSSEQKLIACSMLHSLLYNNQKAKGVFRNTAIVRKLQDCYNQFLDMSVEVEWASTCAQTLKDVLVMLET